LNAEGIGGAWIHAARLVDAHPQHAVLCGKDNEVLQRAGLIAIGRRSGGEARSQLVAPELALPAVARRIGESLELGRRAAHEGGRAEDNRARPVHRTQDGRVVIPAFDDVAPVDGKQHRLGAGISDTFADGPCRLRGVTGNGVEDNRDTWHLARSPILTVPPPAKARQGCNAGDRRLGHRGEASAVSHARDRAAAVGDNLPGQTMSTSIRPSSAAPRYLEDAAKESDAGRPGLRAQGLGAATPTAGPPPPGCRADWTTLTLRARGIALGAARRADAPRRTLS